ncbi:myosin-M heavy chain [Harpegnathos saltator]|uniref:G protein pathway suppressor 2 n=1 Tax=Harpegnathos saltator TaxID=610380 RepID=E2BXH8_HARSA|nr:myosin-M heavy chain [Harpegnathos saltator]EFN79626.1 hypothetical protein EAI_00829 [Harpegnathos saltator]
MPAILAGTSERNEQMWQALKTHIMRERQRKKQEQEADEEEERLRKERERQQKQDVMTLGETREQISNLQNEVSQLQKEKHDLFIELKRVLEEENRKRQQVKESSICPEVLTVGTYSAMNTKVTHPQLFLPITRSTSPMYESSFTGPQLLATGSSKRTFSPPPIPATHSYHISYYKPPPCISNYNLPPPPKSEEIGRRSSDSRAVLWNKNNQYSYYSTTPNAYGYPSITPQPSREAPEPPKPTYPTGSRVSLTTHQPAYVTNIHPMEHKGTYGDEKHYPRSNQLTVHGIPIQQSPQGAKTGGITTGFPVRAPPVIPYQQPPHTSAVSYAGTSNVGTPGRVLYTHGARYLRDM